jgi:hypothetical protein
VKVQIRRKWPVDLNALSGYVEFVAARRQRIDEAQRY